ncbi:MAG: AI-2E family transporter [Bacteroidetes bacterium]|nr:AI-2E family transporter [Bacteroidota bacterium]
MNLISNSNLKQFALLAVIFLLMAVLGWQLIPYMPGILGAVTFYILMREQFFKLTLIHHWKKWATALLFILIALVVFVLPLVAIAQMLLPKLYVLVSDPQKLNHVLDAFIQKTETLIPQLKIDDSQLKAWGQSVAATIPTLLTATASVLTNLVLAFFLLYFMLIEGRNWEQRMQRFLPLKTGNINSVWEATRVMVVSNAIGLPVMAIGQAIIAWVGYWVFGVDSPMLWAIVTGICSMLPVIGSGIVWLPLSLYVMLNGNIGSGVGVLIYSIAITGTADNVIRFTLLRKLGDVHPIITAFGIIIGVPMFGFMGLIFGPLLISYLILLIKIYRVEYSSTTNQINEEVLNNDIAS